MIRSGASIGSAGVKIIIIVAVVAVIGTVAGFVSMRGDDKKGDKEVEVRVETVGRGDLAEIVSAPGQLQPKTKITISARTTARILALPLEEGAVAKKDDVVVQLDSKDLEAQLKSAEAQRKAQLAQVEVEEAQLEAQKAELASTRAE